MNKMKRDSFEQKSQVRTLSCRHAGIVYFVNAEFLKID